MARSPERGIYCLSKGLKLRSPKLQFFLPLILIATFAASQQVTAPSNSTPQPEIFQPGIFSTGDWDTHIEFTPDQQQAYFLRLTPDFNLFWAMFESHLVNGKWSTPQMAPFSGQFSDADPFITPDNKHLYFISNRPLDRRETKPKDDFDIWVMDRQPTGEWGQPRNLGAPVNSSASEYYPRMAADGTLYFGSEREGGKGGADIWRARRNPDGTFDTPENLGNAINTTEDEYEPYISSDQGFLIFMAKRKSGLGSGDLYVSYNHDGHWTLAENVGAPINSSGYEMAPKFSPDGKYFFFTSTRSFFAKPLPNRMTTEEYNNAIHGPGNGLGDIYRIDATALHLKR
jgi:Tol biopolymer transport system component